MKRRGRGRRAFLRPNSDAVLLEVTDVLDEERAIGEDELRGQLRALQAGTLMDVMASRRPGV